jgi:hypothetical protein
MKTSTKSTIIYMLLSALLLFSCDYNKYGKGIKKDTRETFERNKAYIYIALLLKVNYLKKCIVKNAN